MNSPLSQNGPKGAKGAFFYQRENKEKNQGQRPPQELEFGQPLGPYILVHDNKWNHFICYFNIFDATSLAFQPVPKRHWLVLYFL